MTADKLVIRTPEGVEFALPLAGIFSRMIAFATDLAVIAMIQGVLDQILAPLQVFGQDISQGVKVVLFFVIYLVYGALAEWLWHGQTVGKRLMALRVMDSRGMRLEPSQVMVRNLMRFIDGLPLLYLVGGIACVFSRHQQRLGDLAAGTVVVRIPKVASPDLRKIQLPGGAPSPGCPSSAESCPGRGGRSPGVAAAARSASSGGPSGGVCGVGRLFSFLSLLSGCRNRAAFR